MRSGFCADDTTGIVANPTLSSGSRRLHSRAAERDPSFPERLVTVRGVGYSLCAA